MYIQLSYYLKDRKPVKYKLILIDEIIPKYI